MTRVLLGLFGLLASMARLPCAAAQGAPDPGRELRLIESTERNEDPLGLDESTGSDLDRAAARLKKATPQVVLPSARRGAALSSIDGVRESDHTVDVQLTQGLALVVLRFTLSSRAKYAAEVAYRVPLPDRAVITGLKACARERCLSAMPLAPASATSETRPQAATAVTASANAPANGAGTTSARDARARYLEALARPYGAPAAPVVFAEHIVDEAGRALSLRVAPLPAGESRQVEVSYVAEAPLRGGRVRFRIEPRGYDPNLAPTKVRVRSRELTQLSPSEEVEIDGWSALEVSATIAAGRSPFVSEERALCGGVRCSRRYEAATLGAPELRPTWLLIDASPSVEGPTRSRMSGVIAALLSALPEASELRAFAFAAQATELGSFRARDAPLGELVDASSRELDAATHPSSVFALVQRDLARVRPRVVVISDGLFDTTARERDALRNAQKLGAELVLLAIGDAEPRFRELFDRVLALGPIAERALHDNRLEPLMDALRQLAERRVRPGLFGGEQRVQERAPQKAWRPEGHWLSFWLSREQPQPSWSSAVASSAALAIAAVPYLDTERAPTPVADSGLPAESVLSMLRTQLVPQARACLRSDRRGRADYAVGLTFHALFAQREAYETRVEGAIPKALRSCLEALLPKLRVPAFSGRIRVRYPIHTEREPPPPVIALEPEVSRTLERAFGAPRALP